MNCSNYKCLIVSNYLLQGLIILPGTEIFYVLLVYMNLRSVLNELIALIEDIPYIPTCVIN